MHHRRKAEIPKSSEFMEPESILMTAGCQLLRAYGMII